MITLFGPVSEAMHGGSVNPWFSIGAGVFTLVGAWGYYFKMRKTEIIPLVNLLGLTAIGGIFILVGIWELAK